jgi:hypothetical protein
LPHFDRLSLQQLNVVMARVLPDLFDKFVDNLLVTLQRLQEGLIAIEQHAGHSVADVIRQALLQEREQFFCRHGFCRTADVSDLEHILSSRLGHLRSSYTVQELGLGDKYHL